MPMRNAKSENHSLRLGAANTGFVLNPVPTSPGSTLTHARAAFRHPLIMSSCVTPGGVRRIRESIDGPLSDVSVQVRPHRRWRGFTRQAREDAREFRKAARSPPRRRAVARRATEGDTRRHVAGPHHRSREGKPPSRARESGSCAEAMACFSSLSRSLFVNAERFFVVFR